MPGQPGTKRRRVSGNDIDSMDEEALRRTLAQYSQELEAYDEVEDVVNTHTTSVATANSSTSATSDTSMCSILLQILHEIKQSRADNKAVTQSLLNVQQMQNNQGNEIKKLTAALVQQQRFCEGIDAKARETNVLIMGLPDEGKTFCDKTNDNDKVQVILNKMGCTNVNIDDLELHRLGEAGPSKCRPLLLKASCKKTRAQMLENAKELKKPENTDEVKNVYIKKDIHPSVRKEWKRLRDVEDAEKKKPANQGADIKLDPKTRTITKNGTVIDRWQLLGF